MGLITVVAEDRQWFKARCGLSSEGTPREIAFCAHTILADEVLVVEDNELNLKLFCDLLRAHGYSAEPVRDGRDAVARARDFRPDLIVMDVQMPVMDGIAATREIVERDLGVAIDALPGSGAAGGLAGGLHAFIGATLKPGIDVVLETAGFHDLVKTADLVITGEGRIDGQSLAGKVPIGVAQAVRAAGRAIPVIVLAGSVGQDADTLYDEGITAIVPIGRGPQDLATAIRRTAEDLTATARDVGRLVMACSPTGLTR